MTKRRNLNVLSFECVIFLFYVDVNRKFLRRKINVNVKLFFITFSEFYISYLFFILKKIFIVVENMIQIFMTFAFWRKRKTFRFEINMQMKTFFIIHFDFCVNASFFKNIHLHFLSLTSFFVSMFYSLKNIHQHFSSHISVSVSMLHFSKIFISFNNLIIRKIFIFFNKLMKRSW
jgi:hypothetical protein